MTQNPEAITPDRTFYYTFLTYTGAFLLSIILIILIHEIGHYLVFFARGYDVVRIRINPFMGMTSTPQDIQLKDIPYIILGGTFCNLSLATFIGFIIRRKKHKFYMVLQMYPATAFLIEGMVIIAGFFFQEKVTDFAMLVDQGLSPLIVGVLGVFFLLIGGYQTYVVWVLHGIVPMYSRFKIFLLNGPFIIYGLIGILFFRFSLPVEMNFIKNFITLTMILHWLYLGLRILLVPIILPQIQKRMISGYPQVSKSDGIYSILLGSAAWLASLLILN